MTNNNSLIFTKDGKRNIVHFKPIETKNEDLNSWWVLKYCSNLNISGYLLQHVRTQKFLSTDNALKFSLTEEPSQNQIVVVTKYNQEYKTEKVFYNISFKHTKKYEISPNLYQHKKEEESTEDLDLKESEKLKLEILQTHTFYDFQICLSVKRLMKNCMASKCNQNKMLPDVIIALSKLSKFIINEKLSHIKFSAPIIPTRRQIASRQKLLMDINIAPILCQNLQYFISKSMLEPAEHCYDIVCKNILRLLFDISANNSEVKKELLINVMKIPKELWNNQSLLFQNLLQSILDDYPVSLNTTEEEEGLVLDMAQYICERIPLAFVPGGLKMNIGEVSILKKMVEIQWIHKNQVIRKILALNGMFDFLELAAKFIAYLGGQQESEELLTNLRNNM